MNTAISICAPGVPLCTIGNTIQKICDAKGYGVVKEFGGHGIGREIHTHPFIMHFANRGEGIMKPGTPTVVAIVLFRLVS